MKKGQSTLEFVVIIVVIAAGLIAMSVYLKRSIQGKLRASAEQIGEQYAPKNSVINITTRLTSNVTTETRQEVGADGDTRTITTTTLNPEIQTMSGNFTVGPLEEDLFD